MIVVINSQGGLVSLQDEDIFQGSTNLNTIHLVAPFADSVTFKAMFEMPDGTYKPDNLDGYVMQPSIALSKELNVWKLNVTFPITQDYGIINMQIRGTIGDTVVCTTTVKIPVQKGIPYASNFEELGDKDQLLQFIADIRALLSNKVDTVNYVYNVAENITSSTIGTYYVYDSGTDSYIPKTLPQDYSSVAVYYEAISTGRVANRDDGIVLEYIDNKTDTGMTLKIEKDKVTLNGKEIATVDLVEDLKTNIENLENYVDTKIIEAKSYTDEKYEDSKQYTDNATENVKNLIPNIAAEEVEKQDRKDGFSHTTDMNLVIGEPSVSYNNDDGIVVVSQSQIIANGKEYNPTVENRIPIVGSEGVVIDTQETTNKIEVHLDASVTARLARSLVTPISTPTETKIVAVDNTNSQEMLSIGSGLYVEAGELRATGGSGIGGGTIVTEGGVELETWNADKKADVTALETTNTNVSNNSSNISNLKTNKLNKLEASETKELVNVNSEGQLEKTEFTANHLIGLKEQDLTPSKNVLDLSGFIGWHPTLDDSGSDSDTNARSSCSYDNSTGTITVYSGIYYESPANFPVYKTITLKPNTTYTISGNGGTTYTGYVWLGTGTVGNFEDTLVDLQPYSTFVQTFTTLDETEYLIYFTSAADGNAVTFSNLQIEEGETATDFEPYYDTPEEDKVVYASDITIEENTATGNYMLVINKG